MSLLQSAIDQTLLADRRRAMRALLARPVLASRGEAEADYRLVRRFEAELREWLETNTGWRLTVDTTAARLHKRVAGRDTTRGLYDRRRRPFSRRRYVLLALSFAVLERSGGQVTLGRLAEGVLGELGDPRFEAAGLDFTLANREERSDMVSVVRLLLELGALRRIEGDEERYVDTGTDVLYDVEHGVLGVILQTAQAPSMVGSEDFESRLVNVTDHPLVQTDDARNRWFRRSLTRRLLDDPVLLYDSLSDEERAYLVGQRRALTDRITDATGLVAEVRAEGIAMLDPEGDLTDVRMPEGGAAGHLALLIATRLAEMGEMAEEEVVVYTDKLCDEYASVWGTTIRARPRAELAGEAIGRLRALSLVRAGVGRIQAVPVLMRFRLGEPRVMGVSE
jgi:uncharacterized protein (TIGR02678 family)